MSIATTINPQELRPRIEQKLDRLSSDELAMVDSMLTQLEAHRLLDEIGVAADDAREAGKFADIDQALREFRARHPYR
jgi:hypothetical protein